MFTTVLLDVFGTLIDIEEDVCLSPYSYLLSALGLDKEEKSRASRFIYTSHLPTMDDAGNRLESMFPGRSISSDNWRMAATELEEHLGYHRLVAGVPELLSRLKAAGLKLALDSNLATPYEKLVTSHHLHRLVDATVYSFEVGYQKPEPEIFAIALDRLDSDASHTVMIGDDECNDVEVPQTLGIKSRLVEPGAQDAGASLRRTLEWILSKTKAGA